MKLALAQLNPLIGDLNGNLDKIHMACTKAINQGADLVLTPELSLLGYPPRDLLLNKNLIHRQKSVLNALSNFLKQEMPSLKVLVGIAEEAEDLNLPKLFNSIVLIESTGWKVVARKQLLPNYDVFDDKRYFRSSDSCGRLEIEIHGKCWHLGITICEDIWVYEELQEQRQIGPDPIAKFLDKEIDLLINLSASPFSNKKETLRESIAAKAALRIGCPFIYLNQVGGNDELIFDGSSFVLNANADLVLKLPSCKEALTIWNTDNVIKQKKSSEAPQAEKLFEALVLGVRDYACKCNFKSSIIGLSGGIDSSLVAIIAAAALGSSNVKGVMMPSPWSSTGSINDSLNLAKRLSISTSTIPIAELMKGFDSALLEPLNKQPEGITAENLQSRIRGVILMAIANQESHLLLSTGNKSELAVGYCTLYGDMNGGLAVIGDLYKTCVFSLCNWIDSPASKDCLEAWGLSSDKELLGESIRTKPPSAELREGQLDSDSLPDYQQLDHILKALIEKRTNPEKLIQEGQNPSLVFKIERLIKKAEFKRRQSPPVLKVSHQAFGSGWRFPIAAS